MSGGGDHAARVLGRANRMTEATQTHLQYCQELLARAYQAMHPDLGSNDEEHELLYEMTEFFEEEVRKMGGELPPHPEDDE